MQFSINFYRWWNSISYVLMIALTEYLYIQWIFDDIFLCYQFSGLILHRLIRSPLPIPDIHNSQFKSTYKHFNKI